MKALAVCLLLLLGAAVLWRFMAPDRQAVMDLKRATPEGASGYQPKQVVIARRHMVIAGHPLAAEAGREMLRAGGTAMDAAIAVQMVLNLVEPQSSGLGGGGFLLYWDAGTGKLLSYDGRETAPMKARPDRFMRPDGKLLGWAAAKADGRAVGVPGLLRMLEIAHRSHGKRPWGTLFASAIKLADQGFPVSRRLALGLKRAGASRFGPQARRYFFADGGRPRPEGFILKNPAFADTLRQISNAGAAAFYDKTTSIARAIVDRVRKPGLNNVTLTDLAGYRAKIRPNLCGPYRGLRICSMGPPSSAASTILQVLRLIEAFDLGKQPLTADAVDVVARAEQLAYADRGRYLADSDFIDVPIAGLLNDSYLARRRALIKPRSIFQKQQAGNVRDQARMPGRDYSRENSGTTHISIVDDAGNIASMTTSIEAAFGSKIMAAGFLLNNELTDFSFRPVDKQGRAIANRVEGGKRPRSSMAPTIVFDQAGRPVMVLGSPGGSRIILYVLKSLIAHIDWGLGAQDAANLRNFGARNTGRLELETRPASGPHNLAEKLARRGHKAIWQGPMTSGVHIIILRKNWLEGGADPRREGVALGD